MTCVDCNRVLDDWLAGDRAPLDRQRRSVNAHRRACAVCAKIWQDAEQLMEQLQMVGDEAAMAVAVTRARARLRDEYGRHGHPILRFGSLPTPIGRVFVAMSDQGVCDVTLGDPGEEDYRRRLAEYAPEVWLDHEVLEPVLSELEAYFRGRLTRFTVQVDLRRATAFTRRVLGATRRIPFGRLLSYGQVARRIGLPQASRAVGGALGRNPVPIIVPCHRVVAQGGKLGGFTSGLDTKRHLLRIEGHAPGAEAR